MPPAVSIVVAVYNPGPYLRPLLDALDRQQPPPDGFEAIFVDDGSTDGTGELLERWARPRAWAEIVRQPNSGWPSRPRNVGLERARGEFVLFVDHDDWIADDALARLVPFARDAGADVVVGRMGAAGRKVPVALFRATQADARPPATPLQDSMTVHAMFRRTFLAEHGIRFDESVRRLEDHLFMAQAYTRATRVAVYADATVYVHARREDGRGAGYRRYAPAEYYAVLGQAIDTVTAALPPGPERDAYLSRWVRIELVGRLRSDAVRWLPRAERDAFFTSVRDVLATRMPADIVRRVPAAWRWPTALALCAEPDAFLRAEDRLTTSSVAALKGQSGSAALADLVPRAVLQRAVELIGDDPPLPGDRAAAGAAATLRRVRGAALAPAGAVMDGRLLRRLIAWGRTPELLARRTAGAATVVAAALAAALAATGQSAGTALALCVLAAALTVGLSRRSTSGMPTAVRLLLVLAPAAGAAIHGPAGAQAWLPWLAIALGATAIAAGFVLDRRWRRTDIRAHAARRGSVLARLGWITSSALVAALIVLGADAVALASRG